MSTENKPKPMPDTSFRCMMWIFKLFDLFRNPQKRIKMIPLKEGMTVVDYGCGPGRYTIPIAKLVGPKGKVLAIDIQPLAISTVKKKASSEALTNIEATLVDSYHTGIEESSVDLVLLVDTFHMISDYNALLQELKRILRPDGLLFMDSGHMKMQRASDIIENSALFTIKEFLERNILATPK
ncbi:class I SAM-dependent methyltransferase, partial [Chloroflexota bacterium]